MNNQDLSNQNDGNINVLKSQIEIIVTNYLTYLFLWFLLFLFILVFVRGTDCDGQKKMERLFHDWRRNVLVDGPRKTS